MNRLFIDFETYYEPTGPYSLTKMPTMQYVRDDRFECLGAALAAPGLIQPGWYAGEQLAEQLQQLPWDDINLVAHNCAFDAAVLTQQFGLFPARYTCTMLQTRWVIAQGYFDPTRSTRLAEMGNKGDTAGAVAAGGEQLETYAMQDMADLLTLYKQLAQLPIPPMEIDLMDMHVRMAVEPVLSLNTPLLRDVANREPPAAAVQLRKQATFVAALRAYGVEPETKESPRTGKQTYAFAKGDRFMQGLAIHSDPRVRKLHELRITGGSNIDRTRARRFLDVGEPLPVPLLYYGAGTGRVSGLDKLNLQNLKRGGELRQSIVAPEGYKLVVVDSSQVEVRVLAWLAGESSLLSVFAEGRDPYIEFAAEVLFDKPHDDVTKEERRIAKPAILAAGFGQGRYGLMAYASGIGITLDEPTAERAVTGYRSAYARIVQHGENLLREVANTGQIVLPSGRSLTYPDMQWRGRDLVYLRHSIFSKQRKGKRDEIKLWPGFLNENCIAVNHAEVLTPDGWVLMRDVGSRAVWDGLDWVSHDGLTNLRYSDTVTVEGVPMTPDHKVLTNRGWRDAQECKGYQGEAIRTAHCTGVRGQRRATIPLGGAVLKLWHASGCIARKIEGGTEMLRITGLFERREEPISEGQALHTWDVESPRIRSVESNVGQVPVVQPPRLSQLWRARDRGVRGMAARVRNVLGRHGANLPTGGVPGSDRQRWELHPVKLPLGFASSASEQQTEQCTNPDPTGGYDSSASVGRVRRGRNDDTIPDWGGVARGRAIENSRPPEQVADLMNCGPRQRYVTRPVGGGTPIIVHNCTQAAARDLVMWQTLQLAQKYRVVNSVHDECVLCVPDEQAEQAKADALEAFSKTPNWMRGITVAGEAISTDNYSEKP